MTRTLHLLTASLALWLSASAWGQWSTDPQKNTVIADVPGAAQVQPQIAPTADGHWWVSWFSLNPQSAPPRGYDVYLQRLDADGREQLAHQGLQVAKLGVSWTEDYGLVTDARGNALLAFQDDRASPSRRRITVSKIGPSGQPLWGTSPTSATDSQHSPHIAALDNGQAVVGWSTETAVHLQKLDVGGRPLWSSSATVPQELVLDEADHEYRLADLQTAGDGAVIVSFVRSRGFQSARHLYANKISADGKLLWGPRHVRVFDGGTLQHGNFPRSVPDGRGGAVFAWYSVAPAMQIRTQHIHADGRAAFTPNGVPVSTDLRQARVDPSLTYQASTDEITVLWTELVTPTQQRQRGLYAQKINARGARQWGDSGRPIVLLEQGSLTDLHSVAVADGTLAFWVQHGATGAHNSIQAIKLDAAGAPLCAQFPVSTRPSAKSRLTSALSPSGQVLLAWEEASPSQGYDIYLQGLRADCRLGAY